MFSCTLSLILSASRAPGQHVAKQQPSPILEEMSHSKHHGKKIAMQPANWTNLSFWYIFILFSVSHAYLLLNPLQNTHSRVYIYLHVSRLWEYTSGKSCSRYVVAWKEKKAWAIFQNKKTQTQCQWTYITHWTSQLVTGTKLHLNCFNETQHSWKAALVIR